MAQHLAPGELLDFSLNLVSSSRREELEQHFASCATCQALALEEVRGETGSPAPAEPMQIGRFTIKRVVGAGAMGLVFEAHDPQLDRAVAIKLRRGADSPDDERRLLHEARAMARLASPHIAAIHEVGREGETSFLVIEFIAGHTLRVHCARPDVRNDEVLDLLVQAGRGLAAAHLAGVVHRDFKPENVLVDERGRARVTDFGVAALSPRAGLAGTLAYLAPELSQGARATAASDQYSFCVTAFELLARARPDSARPVWPSGVDVKARARAAIVRGLSSQPEARFASMDELLAELAPRPALTPARVALLAAGITAALLGAGWGWSTRPLCDGAPVLNAVLPPDERAFFSSLSHELDDSVGAWSKAWLSEYQHSCEATVVRREASSRFFDARMACLEQQRRALGALVALAHTTPANAGRLVAALPQPQNCASAAFAGEWPPATRDAKTMESAAKELATIEMLVDAGFFLEAQAHLERLRQLSDENSEARAYGAFFEASLERSRGELEAAERHWVWVFQQASRAGDDELALRAAVARARSVGAFGGRQKEAREQLELMRGWVDRLPRGNRMAASYFRAWGEALLNAEQNDEAERQLGEGLDRTEDDAVRRVLEYELAEACFARGRWACALDHAQRALSFAQSSLPADAPTLADFHAAVAFAQLQAGHHEAEAEATLERMEALVKPLPFEQARTEWAVLWSARALQAQTRGDFPSAVRLMRQSVEVWLVVQPARSGRTLLELAWLEVLAGDFPPALADAARSQSAPDAARTKSWAAAVRLRVARVRRDAKEQHLAAPDVDLTTMNLPERLAASVELGEFELANGAQEAARSRCRDLSSQLEATPMRAQLEAPVLFFCARAVEEPGQSAAWLERARASYERGEQPAFEAERFRQYARAP